MNNHFDCIYCYTNKVNGKKDLYKGFKWKFFDMATLSEANTETVGTCND